MLVNIEERLSYNGKPARLERSLEHSMNTRQLYKEGTPKQLQQSFVGRLLKLILKILIYFVDYDNMLLLSFCLRSIFMNGMIRFYFKTTSKIVLTLLFLTRKLRELDLA